MNKFLLAVIIGVSALCGQDGTSVSVSEGPPYVAYTSLFFYDATPNLQYICKARSQQPTFSWTRSLNTLTSIADSANTGTVTTSTAHGLSVGNKVTVSGATVDTDLNGTYVIQTVGSTTTFTITTASVTDATYTEATLAVSTTAARTTAPQWDIVRFTYDGTPLMTNMQHAGGKSATNSICGNRAVTTGSTKVEYQ
jgi:hypothetical protein